MFEAFKILFRCRSLLAATVLNDIKARYAGTTFGLLWIIIYPVLFLGLYSVVYVMIFQVRIGNLSSFDYVLLIFSGLIPFLGFAETLGAGVPSVTSNSNLIKNTLFPIELIPVKAVLASSMTMLVGLILLLFFLWTTGVVHKTQFLLPIILMMQFTFTIGLMWILSALNVFFRDVGQMVTVVILFLMLVSPIAYTVDMIPEKLMPLMYVNPLFYLISMYRDALVRGEVLYSLWSIFFGISMAFYVIGFFLFSRLKTLFADFV